MAFPTKSLEVFLAGAYPLPPPLLALQAGATVRPSHSQQQTVRHLAAVAGRGVEVGAIAEQQRQKQQQGPRRQRRPTLGPARVPLNALAQRVVDLQEERQLEAAAAAAAGGGYPPSRPQDTAPGGVAAEAAATEYRDVVVPPGAAATAGLGGAGGLASAPGDLVPGAGISPVSDTLCALCVTAGVCVVHWENCYSYGKGTSESGVHVLHT